jgi:hypothetical protein
MYEDILGYPNVSADPRGRSLAHRVSGLAPEIAMWRLYTDDMSGEEDWYIKPNV